MSGSKKQKYLVKSLFRSLTHFIFLSRNPDALPQDLEKAAQPIMDRAQRVKEQVTEATFNVKQSVEAKAKAIREKSGKQPVIWRGC
jgi:hypothetical protein